MQQFAMSRELFLIINVNNLGSLKRRHRRNGLHHTAQLTAKIKKVRLLLQHIAIRQYVNVRL